MIDINMPVILVLLLEDALFFMSASLLTM